MILLEETSTDATEIVSNAATTETDFFSYGIWENRDINQESIRAKAWRDNNFITLTLPPHSFLRD